MYGRIRQRTGRDQPRHPVRAVGRLLDDDWIERFDEKETPRGRQAYRLTSVGRRNLQCEVDRMKHLTRLAALRVATNEN